MYASLKSLFSWPLSLDHLRWLSLLLCSCSTLGNALIYCLDRPLPLILLLLNIAALTCIWVQYGYSRKSIRFQPQELADRLLQVWTESDASGSTPAQVADRMAQKLIGR